MDPISRARFVALALRGGTPHDVSKPIVNNADGSYGTEYTMTQGDETGEHVIPTIVGGVPFSPWHAANLWRLGLNSPVGSFVHPQDAEDYAQGRHERESILRGREAEDLSPLFTGVPR